MKISKEGDGGTELTVVARPDTDGATFKVDGSMQATNVVFSSSRALKPEIQPVDPLDVLARVQALPVSEWRFKDGRQNVRHIGPMAEDFQAAFGLAASGKTISVTDTSGVALAAIQGLNTELQAKDAEIQSLRTRIEALEQAIAKLTPQQ